MTTRTKKPPAPIPSAADVLLSKAQICQALGISLRTFEAMRSTGEYPQPDTRIRRQVRWHCQTHNEWLARRCGRDGKV